MFTEESEKISLNKLNEIIEVLNNFIIKEDYKGYDPYDVLNSPIFKLPVLSSNKLIRFISQQIFRRLPFNLRPILGIQKEFNPVTAGLCIQAYTYLMKIYEDKRDFYEKEIKYLLDKLEQTKSKGYSGYCWGYNFDWEARYAKIPKFCPTVVATGIITNGLYEYWLVSKNKVVEEILISSANFVLNDLNRTYEGDTFCFSYSPNDKQLVYNATMKGARLLAQVYSITGDKNYINEAKNTVQFVVNNQNEDGSWYYSKGDARVWVDNFHTAYVIDALKSFIQITKTNEYENSFNKAIEYYLKKLFSKEGYPKYYSNSLYPIDATACAQSIITLTNLGFLSKANEVINFCIKSLYNDVGYFYYQVNKYNKNRNIYIRWSNAYFFSALSFYNLRARGNNALV